MRIRPTIYVFLLLLALTSCDGDAWRTAKKVWGWVEAASKEGSEAMSYEQKVTNETKKEDMNYSPIIERNLTQEERYAIAHSMFPQGSWSGEKGESVFMPDNLDAVPRRGQYSNMRNLTWREILKENGCEQGIPYKNGEVDYEALHQVYARVTFDGDKGIGEYLRPKNGNYDRQYLHEEAYARLARQKGVSVEEVKVYKGDTAPVVSLMAEWCCTEQEVWRRCGNPERRVRVCHECADGRTVILVPRELHDHLSHCGGVEMYDRAQEKE